MEKPNFIIGITGGSGSGKTTLLRAIEARGGLILDCDAIYHRLLKTDAALLQAIEARFPGVVEGGTLNRKALGGRVFADAQALAELNRITHGAICAEVSARLANQDGLAAIDAIALFESGLDELCDVTVAVTAPVEARVRRLMARDGISEEYARSRIAAQKSDGWFAEKCDRVLENNGSMDAFATKCLAFLDSIGIMEA